MFRKLLSVALCVDDAGVFKPTYLATFLLGFSLIATLSGCANPETTKPRVQIVTHLEFAVAKPGHLAKVGFFNLLYADCSSLDYSTIRIIEPPSHGSIEFHQGSDFSRYPTYDQRHDCNKKKSPGVILNYTSDPKFSGEDKFKIEVIWPNAMSEFYDYKLRIGATSTEQGAKEIQAFRTVLSGSEQKIAFYSSLYPDCTTTEALSVRLVKPPMHGVLRMESGDDYPSYDRFQSQYACNKEKSRGTLIYFRPDSGFVGLDSAEIELTYFDQTINMVVYNITVK
jgi:hypothetical protein